MKFLGKTAVFLAAGMLSMAAHADVKVDQPWARATVPGQPASGVFMGLTSDIDARLVAAESDAAEHVEIHEMLMENDVMRMRQVPGLALPAGQSVVLKPGGYHIMLIGLKQQLKEGEQISLTLVFEQDGKQEKQVLEVPVRPLTQGQHGAGHQGHGGHTQEGHAHHGSH